MNIASAQRSSIPLRSLAAAGAVALVLAGCGGESPPPPKPQPAAPAPQAQTQPAPAPAASPVPAPAPAPEQAEKPDPDKALATKVHDALRAALGSLADGIDVTASGGKVTLWGTVPEAPKRSVAVRAAAGVAGVKSVKDNMAVVAGS
jgi:pyruvate dehydrogenase E2 component (dihydrolipoyllysine-residue acetyltransferase)